MEAAANGGRVLVTRESEAGGGVAARQVGAPPQRPWRGLCHARVHAPPAGAARLPWAGAGSRRRLSPRVADAPCLPRPGAAGCGGF